MSAPTRARSLLRRALALAAVTAGLAGVQLGTAGAAHAGQVGVTVSISGRGALAVSEGSPEDGVNGYCRNKDAQKLGDVITCDRFRDSEVFEAWVWLRPYPGDPGKPGDWTVYGWGGCDEMRTKDGVVECGVHSSSFGTVEKTPKVFFRDAVAPATPSLKVTTDARAERSVEWDIRSGDDGRNVCRIDEQPQFDCGSFGTRQVEEGKHTFTAWRVDSSANHSPPVTSTFWTVDTAVTSGPKALDTSATATFGLSSGAAEGFACSLDGAAYATCAGGRVATATFTGLSEGPHTVSFRADRDGWRDPIPATRSWTVDTVAPTSTVERYSQTGRRLVITASTDDAASTLECRLTGPGRDGAWASCAPGSVVFDDLTDGTYSAETRATDEAGNTGPVARTTAVVDSTAPTAVITSAQTDGTSARFAFSAPDATAFSCRVTALGVVGEWKACTSPFSLSGLAPGAHRLEVAARDARGNVQAVPTVHDWRVVTPVPDGVQSGPVADTVAPETALTSGPVEGALVTSTSATLVAAASEVGTCACTLDGAALPCADGRLALTGLGAGRHEVRIAAVDAAGNRDATPVVRSWRVPTGVAAMKTAKGFKRLADATSQAGTSAVATRRGATLTAPSPARPSCRWSPRPAGRPRSRAASRAASRASRARSRSTPGRRGSASSH